MNAEQGDAIPGLYAPIMFGRQPDGGDLGTPQIEYDAQIEEYVVYSYGEYSKRSAAAGRERKVWLDAFPTLPEAMKAYPMAKPDRWALDAWVDDPRRPRTLPAEAR